MTRTSREPMLAYTCMNTDITKLIGSEVFAILETRTTKTSVKGLLDLHPCGDGSYLVSQDGMNEMSFTLEEVVKMDPHKQAGYPVATLYITPTEVWNR